MVPVKLTEGANRVHFGGGEGSETAQSVTQVALKRGPRNHKRTG